MQVFEAFVYGPNLPINGLPVAACFNNHHLHIDTLDLDIEITVLEVSVGGFDHNECFLNWQGDDATRWALKPRSQNGLATLLLTAPASLKPQLGKWHHRRRRIKMVWGALGSIATVLILSLGLLWWRYDHVVTWVADHVSLAKEQQLGNSLLAEIKAEGDIVERGAAVQTVRKIGAQLTQGSRYKYQWLVKKDNNINAFALPGGIVIVHTALLKKMDNPDELAAVLAHEVQHVEQRHALKSMIHSLGWAAALMVILGDVNTATAVVVHQMGSMYFSRDIEDEADRLGYQALVKAKIAPDGMVSFFQKLQQHEGNAEAPEWISSHPATAERIKTIQNLLKEQPCPQCQALQLDWKRVQGDKALTFKG